MTAPLQYLPIEQLLPGQYQMRQHFDVAALEQLAASIRSAGLVQPIVVRPHPVTTGSFEIIAGERRWRAAQLVGLATVPCWIRAFDDQQAAAVTSIENGQREDLNPIEEAMGYQRLIDEFAYHHDMVADTVGKSRAVISNAVRLLRLDSRVQDLLRAGSITMGHGKMLVGLASYRQYPIACRCIKRGWTVRQLEHAIQADEKPRDIVSPSPRDPNIASLERRIAEHLGAAVQLRPDPGKPSGYLQIRYLTPDSLAGILTRLGLKDE